VKGRATRTAEGEELLGREALKRVRGPGGRSRESSSIKQRKQTEMRQKEKDIKKEMKIIKKAKGKILLKL
jgi:hypothetical protein